MKVEDNFEKRAYKICLSSTHGTGKTTLAAAVERELKARGIRSKRVEEMATKAIEKGLSINENTTFSAQMWILYRQFSEEVLYAEKRPNPPNYDVIICDRGPDNYGYLKHRFKEDLYMKDALEDVLTLTLTHMKLFPYDRIYLLPIVETKVVAYDGLRATDLSFKKEMDQEIRNFFRENNFPYIELPQPEKEDKYRDEWTKIIANQTLLDLKKPATYFMK
ncbi:ATP-binding protein [Candidatus Woesearchaeota archaeon]|nr:ATP-binding protein [Candidatus Woesearchaeota archaeon]